MSEQHLRLFIVGDDGPEEIDADRARLYVDEDGIQSDEGADCQECQTPSMVGRFLTLIGAVLSGVISVLTSLPALALLAGVGAAALLED